MWLIDFILHIGDHLQELVKNYGNWIYAILFAIVFCETGLVVLPFLPGDSMLFAAGAIAAVGDMNVFVLMGLLIIAAVLGDFVNFEIGKHFGQRLFANPSSKIFKQSYLQKTHDYYEKYGGRTIIIARFIPSVRTFAPFVGGMGKMNYAQFARYNVMGALDKWTIIRGLGMLLEIQRTAAKSPILFIRISSNSLKDKDFFEWFKKRLQDSRLSGRHLVLEIKEDNADDCFEETKQLRARLREIGCGLALSHFGGKSHSDRLLSELVPDYIKLDGSLIERLAKAKDEKSRQAMALLTEQARDLRTRVVAAGVSTAPQMASIWQFGVTLVQGNMVAEAGPRLDFDFRQYAG